MGLQIEFWRTKWTGVTLTGADFERKMICLDLLLMVNSLSLMLDLHTKTGKMVV